MKHTLLELRWIGLLLAALFSPLAWSHASLVESEPADASSLSVSPEQLVLTYSKPVRLTRVTLEHTDNGDLEFGFKRSPESHDSYRWDLPELANGFYQVNWIALGQDGHKMKGSFSFSLESGN